MSVPFRIGMIGCGTVGTGVLELLARRRAELERATGRPLQVTRIVVQDLARPRHHLSELLDKETELSADVQAVTRASDVDLVVEVAGGVDGPREWMLDALRGGRDVVTANKAALAFHGREIFQTAREHGRCVFYEASVAAAIPAIEILENGLVGNRITRLYGILNGTCNYILSRMEDEQIGYEEALKEAQEKGFAEADPSLDVGGDDTAHKLALLAGIITHSFIDASTVYTEGMTRISREDIEFTAEFGYRIKMLGIARCDEHRAWELRVHPALISREDILAQVKDEFNAIELRGSAAGPMLLFGKGAGALPTASSVVADIVRAARGTAVPPLNAINPPERVDIDHVELRNYIRMTVLDAPGILGRITSFLGMRNISIASIHQPEAKIGYPVPVVVITHKTGDRVISDALRDLEKAQLLKEPAVRIRIEE